MDAVLVAIYLVLRFGFDAQLEALNPWSMYLIEVVLVGVSIGKYRAGFKTLLNFPYRLIMYSLLAMFAGLVSAYGAIAIGLPIPFDTSAMSGVAMLLLVAPILEEGVFRFFLWWPFERRNKPTWAWGFTTLCFSYAHWHAAWTVPVEWQGFLAYQTCYTLVLGLACGAAVYFLRSLTGAILLHFAFNLGFFITLCF